MKQLGAVDVWGVKGTNRNYILGRTKMTTLEQSIKAAEKRD
jgi:hypothetical protein